MKNLINKLSFKALNFLDNKKGASNVEIIVWISVVLILATVLYLFRDAVAAFIGRAIDRVGQLGVS